jgi:hypothetical protein
MRDGLRKDLEDYVCPDICSLHHLLVGTPKRRVLTPPLARCRPSQNYALARSIVNIQTLEWTRKDFPIIPETRTESLAISSFSYPAKDRG